MTADRYHIDADAQLGTRNTNFQPKKQSINVSLLEK